MGMFSLTFMALLVVLVLRAIGKSEEEQDLIPKKLSLRLQALWDEAQRSMRENKFIRAEKSLLTILKLDHTSAAAYNRLGILYSKQKEFKDAIDCFEIASSLDPSASSFHNLGLIYYETENYPKAALAFEQALRMEDTLATRHIAYAKVLEKLGNTKGMLTHLEKAAEIEPNPESYELLARAYEDTGYEEEATAIRERIKTLIMPSSRPRRIIRTRRAVVS